MDGSKDWKTADSLRRAKIVATLGPSSSSEATFRELVRAGLDVARLNFSHGSHEQKSELIAMVRKVAKEEGKPICILADLQGPKIRTGALVDHKPVLLTAGHRLTITPEQIEGTAERVSTVFKTLAENLKRGDQILLSDGLIELRVVEIAGVDVVTEIVNGGMLGEKKGINLPGVAIKVPSLTEKDEIPPEKVPAIQKHIIRRAAEYRKPVITATQMLESMVENPRPTRAEASDVANAIYDGSDAVMLSAESAAGKYPVEAVAMMNKIVCETEIQMRLLEQTPVVLHKRLSLTIPETICECMAHSAQDMDLAAIAIFTESGNTARLLSKYRPDAPIYALSPFQVVVNRSMMLWGTYPILCKRYQDTDKLVEMAEDILEAGGHVRAKQIVGIVGGTVTKTGATNFMRLHLVGDR
jgi:pyruvate kinase